MVKRSIRKRTRCRPSGRIQTRRRVSRNKRWTMKGKTRRKTGRKTRRNLKHQRRRNRSLQKRRISRRIRSVSKRMLGGAEEELGPGELRVYVIGGGKIKEFLNKVGRELLCELREWRVHERKERKRTMLEKRSRDLVERKYEEDKSKFYDTVLDDLIKLQKDSIKSGVPLTEEMIQQTLSHYTKHITMSSMNIIRQIKSQLDNMYVHQYKKGTIIRKNQSAEKTEISVLRGYVMSLKLQPPIDTTSGIDTRSVINADLAEEDTLSGPYYNYWHREIQPEDGELPISAPALGGEAPGGVALPMGDVPMDDVDGGLGLGDGLPMDEVDGGGGLHLHPSLMTPIVEHISLLCDPEHFDGFPMKKSDVFKELYDVQPPISAPALAPPIDVVPMDDGQPPIGERPAVRNFTVRKAVFSANDRYTFDDMGEGDDAFPGTCFRDLHFRELKYNIQIPDRPDLCICMYYPTPPHPEPSSVSMDTGQSVSAPPIAAPPVPEQPEPEWYSKGGIGIKRLLAQVVHRYECGGFDVEEDDGTRVVLTSIKDPELNKRCAVIDDTSVAYISYRGIIQWTGTGIDRTRFYTDGPKANAEVVPWLEFLRQYNIFCSASLPHDHERKFRPAYSGSREDIPVVGTSFARIPHYWGPAKGTDNVSEERVIVYGSKVYKFLCSNNLQKQKFFYDPRAARAKEDLGFMVGNNILETLDKQKGVVWIKDTSIVCGKASIDGDTRTGISKPLKSPYLNEAIVPYQSLDYINFVRLVMMHAEDIQLVLFENVTHVVTTQARHSSVQFGVHREQYTPVLMPVDRFKPGVFSGLMKSDTPSSFLGTTRVLKGSGGNYTYLNETLHQIPGKPNLLICTDVNLDSMSGIPSGMTDKTTGRLIPEASGNARAGAPITHDLRNKMTTEGVIEAADAGNRLMPARHHPNIRSHEKETDFGTYDYVSAQSMFDTTNYVIRRCMPLWVLDNTKSATLPPLPPLHAIAVLIYNYRSGKGPKHGSKNPIEDEKYLRGLQTTPQGIIACDRAIRFAPIRAVLRSQRENSGISSDRMQLPRTSTVSASKEKVGYTHESINQVIDAAPTLISFVRPQAEPQAEPRAQLEAVPQAQLEAAAKVLDPQYSESLIQLIRCERFQSKLLTEIFELKAVNNILVNPDDLTLIGTTSPPSAAGARSGRRTMREVDETPYFTWIYGLKTELDGRGRVLCGSEKIAKGKADLVVAAEEARQAADRQAERTPQRTKR